MSHISEFVVQGGQSVTAGEVSAFRQHLAAYKLKGETLAAAGEAALAARAGFLIRYIEDVLDDVHVPADFSALPEAVFAIRYLVKAVDIIPDNVAGGLEDDAAVIGAVYEGHGEEFRRYAASNGLEIPL